MIEEYLDLEAAERFGKHTGSVTVMPTSMSACRSLLLVSAMHGRQCEVLTSYASRFPADLCSQLYLVYGLKCKEVLPRILSRDDLSLDELLILLYAVRRGAALVYFGSAPESVVQCMVQQAVDRDPSLLLRKELVMISRRVYAEVPCLKAWASVQYGECSKKALMYFEVHGIQKLKLLMVLYGMDLEYVSTSDMIDALHRTYKEWTAEELEVAIKMEGRTKAKRAPICQKKNYKKLLMSGKMKALPDVFWFSDFETSVTEKLSWMSREDGIEVLRYTCQELGHFPRFYTCPKRLQSAVFREYRDGLQQAWDSCFKGKPLGDTKYLCNFLSRQKDLSEYIDLLGDDTVLYFLEHVSDNQVRKALLMYCKERGSYAVLESKKDAFSSAVQAKIAHDVKVLVVTD